MENASCNGTSKTKRLTANATHPTVPVVLSAEHGITET